MAVLAIATATASHVPGTTNSLCLAKLCPFRHRVEHQERAADEFSTILCRTPYPSRKPFLRPKCIRGVFDSYRAVT